MTATIDPNSVLQRIRDVRDEMVNAQRDADATFVVADQEKLAELGDRMDAQVFAPRTGEAFVTMEVKIHGLATFHLNSAEVDALVAMLARAQNHARDVRGNTDDDVGGNAPFIGRFLEVT